MLTKSDATTVFVLIAIGTNLPDLAGRSPLAVAQLAASSLSGLAGLRIVALSRWYRSAPVPPSGQPPYINGVALLSGTTDPARLLAELQAIERAAGRQRGAANAARTLDLDIIDIAGMVRDAPDPVLPHPRAHLRAFVLRPLADVCPDWVHPVLRTSVAALIAGLPAQQICAI